MLGQTLRRTTDRTRFTAPLIVCNEEHRFLVGETLRQEDVAAEAILLEPVARNTAPAACVAALRLAERDPGSLMLLLPSDHRIGDQTSFFAGIDRAAKVAAEGHLVTFGIAPDHPETGYGYVGRAEELDGLPGCYRVARFVEKPDVESAKSYLASGDYSWNSGMFLFLASRLLDEMTRIDPALVSICRAALEDARPDLDFLRLDRSAFAKAPSISLDHAVMEKTDCAAVVPVEIDWSDLGSWQALWQADAKNDFGNVLSGDVIALESKDCYLRSDGRLLAVLGVEDLAVVVTRDAVLVCPRNRDQLICQIVEQLEAAGREEATRHARVARPWGSYERIDAGEGFQAKHLIIKPGASISLQRHRHRAEHWVVVRGRAEVTRGDDVFTLEVNQSTYIPQGAMHRLKNPDREPLHVVEVQSGDYLGEDDIERFGDLYGRE